MSTLSLLPALLILPLTLYALALYLGAASFVWTRLTDRGRQKARGELAPDRAISVLVPARDEGAMVLRVVRSLLEQDTSAPVDVYVLLRDVDDGSWPHLERAYAEASDRPDTASMRRLAVGEGFAGRRSLSVVFVDAEGKAEKLNALIPKLRTPLTAVLDCDHQARPDWLRSAALRLEATRARVVQSRRYGLRADGLFSLWDSLHQHVGCELSNVAFQAPGLTVFLTGTTFVAETELLAAHLFRPCLTEDVDLSYALLMRGERVAVDPHTGSDEEVSPDLRSFLARRRRWANGHTAAFLRHLPRLGRAPLRTRDRVQFLFHGLHYLVALAVWAVHLTIGLLFGFGLPLEAIVGALAVGVLCALSLARAQPASTLASRVGEVSVLTLWLAPLALILASLLRAALLADPSYAALPFPAWLSGAALVAFLAPLVVLLVGLVGFRLFTPSVALVVVLSFPIAFYLDLAGVLLGLLDWSSGRGRWHHINRAAPVTDAFAPGERGALTRAVSIPESFRARALVGRIVCSASMALPRELRSKTTLAWLVVFALFSAGFVYSRVSRVVQAERACRALPHDGDPWIVGPERIRGYCESPPAPEGSRWSRPASRFEPAVVDALSPPGPSRWERLGTTFDCNLARFAPDNVEPAEGGGVALVLREETSGDREFTSGSLATHAGAEAEHLFGRFEAVLKPARGAGLISAFFLHRRDPWQEIDVEFLGRDTTKVLFNVYFNPGEAGGLYNYGYAGTPVLVELGFDAADDFHRYAIEWDVDELRFFVDERLVHRRRAGRPTPIPHLPMRLHMNLWATCAEDLAGPVARDALPAVATFREVRIATRRPSALLPLLRFFDGLVGAGPTGPEPEPGAWQDDAEWLSRYRSD